MITGNIKDAKRYYSVNENFESAFKFLEKLDIDSTGEFEFEGFRGCISEMETSDLTKEGKEKTILEAHRKYLDIHFVIDGSEGIGYANIDTLKAETEYNEEEDYLLLTGRKDKIILQPGEFCVVFPEDAHTPGMCGIDNKLKKAVVKIKL